MTTPSPSIRGLQIQAPAHPAQERVLTPAALEFIVDLQRRFNPRRMELLAARSERQKRLDAGEKPDFLPQTKSIRESEWTVAPIPADLMDRRVEITGPVDRKMIINALKCSWRILRIRTLRHGRTRSKAKPI
jgi:malate synthase